MNCNTDLQCSKCKICLIFKWIKINAYNILHIFIDFLLTGYVVIHWDKCISMQLFSQFDGNNILFLVWIVLIFLQLYEVDGKFVHVTKRKNEKAQRDYDATQLSYELEVREKQFTKLNTSGEEDENGLSS